MSQITYGRVRDIIGPNAAFVSQSGMFPQKSSDISAADGEDRQAREKAIHEQALMKEFGVPVTATSSRMLRILGGYAFPCC